MSDTGVYFCDKCNWPEPKCLCVTRPEPPKMVEIKEQELASLRAKAEAYDKGKNLWMSFDVDTNEPYAVDRDVAVVTHDTWKLLGRHPQGNMPGGFIKKQVRVCEDQRQQVRNCSGHQRERKHMTTREKLLHDINQVIDGYEETRNEVTRIVNQYAIGRWVSVDERLPNVGFMGMVKHKTFGKGLMRMTHDRVGSFFNEKCSAGVSVKDEITHWLELVMPSGKGEA